VTGKDDQVDRMLADALRGRSVAWPDGWTTSETEELVLRRIDYHGVVGLIAGRFGLLAGWPSQISRQIRNQAVSRAMWELRHRAELSRLLAALSEADILAIVLKGTALAYDLYPVPATRERGDSDILIAPGDLARGRAILRRLGFQGPAGDDGAADDLAWQEVWTLVGDDGMAHHVDLHWQLLNTPALHDVLPFSNCSDGLIALPRLSSTAWSMDRVRTLIHTCIHRMLHVTASYFVGGLTYHGGNRLIWIHDIHLLAEALTDVQWTDFCALAAKKGVSAVCSDGLDAARTLLGTSVPHRASERLASPAHRARASAYLLGSRQLGRNWLDLLAIRGFRKKLSYVKARTLPSTAFIRAKYAGTSSTPLALLYVRRLVDLLRARPDRS